MKNVALPFVNEQIKILLKLKKRARINYFISSSLLMLINITTIIVAILAIYDINHDNANALEIALASLSAIFIITLFFLHGINIIYRGIMKDRIYKEALDGIQHELFQYTYKRPEYKVKNPKELLEKNIVKIYEKTLVKNRISKSSLFWKIMTGGNNE